jgi:hypothetical protein
MEKIARILAAGLSLAILISSCNDASKKDMSDASNNIKEANADVKEAVIVSNDSAKAAAISNWNTFKNESDSAIAGMEKEAKTIEAKIAKANNKEKEKLQAYLKSIKEKLNGLKMRLEQKNIEFKNDINKFDATVVTKSQSFEREFKHDMNELGTSFKNIFKDNVK